MDLQLYKIQDYASLVFWDSVVHEVVSYLMAMWLITGKYVCANFVVL